MQERTSTHLAYTTPELLSPNVKIDVIGTGIGGPVLGLELTRLLLPSIRPNIQFHDINDYINSSSSTHCKGCAGGVLEETLEELIASYDVQHQVEIGKDIMLHVYGKEQALSHNTIKKIAVHLPGMGVLYPTVNLADNRYIIPTFRASGPRQTKIDQIGLNAFLLQLLSQQFEQGLPFHKQNISSIDITQDKPVIISKSGERITSDLIVVASGISRGNIPIITKDGENRIRPPGISAYLTELAVEDGNATDKLYGKNRDRAHVLILPKKYDVQYVFFLPQVTKVREDGVVKEKTIVTMAAFGREKRFITPASLNAVFDEHAINYFPGAKNGSLACNCGSYIPSGPINIETLKELAKHGVLIFGDAAGTGKLLKNGIGSTANQAKTLAQSLISRGISREALIKCVEDYYNLYVPDNLNYGKPLLEWVDHIYERRNLALVMNAFLGFEQFLPSPLQKALPNIANAATGAISYEQIIRNLHQGPIGLFITAMCSLIGEPTPKITNKSFND